jgi:hypothetical protein
MRYAMLICGVEDADGDQRSETPPETMNRIMDWVARWRDAGAVLPGGDELDLARTARTIRPGPDGPVVTDGPYLELKEVVGGILFLQAEDIDAAVAIAATWPGLAAGRATSVEVRPVMDH